MKIYEALKGNINIGYFLSKKNAEKVLDYAHKENPTNCYGIREIELHEEMDDDVSTLGVENNKLIARLKDFVFAIYDSTELDSLPIEERLHKVGEMLIFTFNRGAFHGRREEYKRLAELNILKPIDDKPPTNQHS